MPKKASLIVVIVLALILSVTTYAFAAANTVPATNAGDGSATISGYAITGVTYTVTNDTITGMSFTVTPLVTATNYAKSVSVRLTSGGTWYSCTMGADNLTATCSGMNVTAASASLLQVVAAQ
jgi:hypothetical protein